jgi:hypothetical protein
MDVVFFQFKRACRVAATLADLHMRTWSNALPRRHHAEAASIERFRADSRACEKARSGTGFAGSPYALAED